MLAVGMCVSGAVSVFFLLFDFCRQLFMIISAFDIIIIISQNAILSFVAVI